MQREVQKEVRQKNKRLLSGIYAFADALLGEILERRCDPESGFYLQGLPLMEKELLSALQQDRASACASVSVLEAWNAVKNALQAETVSRDMPRMIQLCWLYGMDELWILAVILAFVQRSAPKYEKVFALLQGDSGRMGLDVFLTEAMVAYLQIEADAAQLLAESRRKTELFEERENGELFLRRSVFLWLLQEEDLKLSLRDIFVLHQAEETVPALYQEQLEWCGDVIERELPQAEKLLFEVQGRKGAGKKYFCTKIAERIGYQLGVIRLSALSEHPTGERRGLLGSIFFFCRVYGCLPYLDLTGCAEWADTAVWAKEIAAEYKLLFIGTELNDHLTEHMDITVQKIRLERLSMEDSLKLWQWMGSRFPVADDMDYEQLAGKYHLLPAAIREIFVNAERNRQQNGKDSISFMELLSCIQAYDQYRGNQLMERIDAVFTWKDLKVESKVIEGMQLACAHLKYRYAMQQSMGVKIPYGKGVGVLMYGPPGTGKTMAAQVIANELQMNLYRVDLGQISSKYIGETEKNLEEVLREAENANVILFFDEADALFGKRSEVKDAKDKYANQETSYILQRIESYEGMIILATNFAQNFDPAFMRRIAISIHFELPDAKLRKELWRDMLQGTPLAEDSVTIEKLAEQFELSGSNIKSIVRNGMLLALMENRSMWIGDIARAIKVEFEKLGKIPNVSSFGSFYGYL